MELSHHAVLQCLDRLLDLNRRLGILRLSRYLGQVKNVTGIKPDSWLKNFFHEAVSFRAVAPLIHVGLVLSQLTPLVHRPDVAEVLRVHHMHHTEDFDRVMPRSSCQPPHTDVRQGTEIVRDEFTPCGIAVGISSALIYADNIRMPAKQVVIVLIQFLVVGHDDVRPCGYGIDHTRGCTYKQKGRYVQRVQY